MTESGDFDRAEQLAVELTDGTSAGAAWDALEAVRQRRQEDRRLRLALWTAGTALALMTGLVVLVVCCLRRRRRLSRPSPCSPCSGW